MVISSWIFSSHQLPIYKGDISRVYMHNLHPGVNLLPGANLYTGAYLHPLQRCVHMPTSCVHMHLNLI